MKRLIFSFSVLFLLFILSCKKNGQLPLVTTLRPYETGRADAMCGGVIYTQGKDEITAKGVCWSTTKNPTINENFSSDGQGSKNFSSKITGLKQNTTYHVRAYATNKYGTSYGSDEILILIPAPLPVISGKAIQSVFVNSAVSLATVVVGHGVAPLLKTGFCWSRNGSPNIDSNFTAGTVDLKGVFSTTINGLAANTTYTLRAFATNSTGTSYSDPTIIRTNYGTMTDIDQNVYQTIQIGTQVWMKENLRVTKYRDGTPIPLGDDYEIWTQPSTSVTGVYCHLQYPPYTYNEIVYYNWAVAANPKNVAPDGWHVPTREEIQQLIATLGGQNNASEKLRSDLPSAWPYAQNGSNSTGFSAFAQGYRYGYYFYDTQMTAFFWTSSFANTFSASCYKIDEITSLLTTSQKSFGLNIRLIKD